MNTHSRHLLTKLHAVGLLRQSPGSCICLHKKRSRNQLVSQMIMNWFRGYTPLPQWSVNCTNQLMPQARVHGTLRSNSDIRQEYCIHISPVASGHCGKTLTNSGVNLMVLFILRGGAEDLHGGQGLTTKSGGINSRSVEVAHNAPLPQSRER